MKLRLRLLGHFFTWQTQGASQRVSPVRVSTTETGFGSQLEQVSGWSFTLIVTRSDLDKPTHRWSFPFTPRESREGGEPAHPVPLRVSHLSPVPVTPQRCPAPSPAAAGFGGNSAELISLLLRYFKGGFLRALRWTEDFLNSIFSLLCTWGENSAAGLLKIPS